jgi:DNA repair photolyase
MYWPTVEITDKGKTMNAIAPFIISASRSTDIPAFYAKEFFESLKRGYFNWTNPFNGKKSLISFSKTRFIVFWSKNPAPVIPYLNNLENLRIGYYFNYTLNDYEHEGLEPNLPELKKRITLFRSLSEQIGRERVIWRFDPLILLKGQQTDTLINKINSIAEKLYLHTDKLVFSFVDTSYRKVKNKIKKSEICIKEFSQAQKNEIAGRLSETGRKYSLKIASCAQKDDFSKFNIIQNKCIDDELILKISPNDNEIIDFVENLRVRNRLKDKSQRKECMCIPGKDTGAYNSCGFNCLYCYAGSINPQKGAYRNIFE